ncbi:MAG: dehydrogenase E1 component subunit alpha/beta [Saprospiraceae bacterium]|nr:dehydrogenase E1 component subunit alpha/beta [Saprospiraceae bacterium]MBK6783676.1 dehydrogenase E1 component subunit alpha/beta [Saprospiraceae bacterium]MBK7524640.1 dehydrogenase E1 component subunit alpha/beta [Saprospiraceae bacterium]MBK8373038.1 dehydrogenase E1 component subunit alpha/beta [Saprospiraceae bacterium]MBK8547678.1 dehydrogenase E1 component subunit alpha/beta [Saprospiraceae bacterium]
MQFDKKTLQEAQLIKLYEELLRPRLIEEKMLILLRQGKVSKWFSGIGQEAISVGCALALQKDEKIFTMHRNLGVFTAREMPLVRLFCQWQGKAMGFTKGRDRSFHFGAPEYHIVGMISHLGPQLSLAAGVALGHVLSDKPKVSLAFTGEGGTSQGEFHEALNTAAVWKLPVIFVIENNGYGLSTPTKEQFVCNDLADKGPGYGMKSVTIDGNNILEVYHTISKIAGEIRKNPEPWLVECKTFRMRGHEEASGTKYVPQELMDFWATKDPVQNFENYLTAEGILKEEVKNELIRRIKKEIDEALQKADNEPAILSSEEGEMADVYAPFQQKTEAPGPETEEKRFVDAITDGLDQAMTRHDNLILMGQDIAEYGGVFKVTQGFVEKYGKHRVRNTPLCESAIVGIGLGLSMEGYKAMVEMQFADFVTCGFNQIINNLAKLHYRWGEKADVVIRMPSGGGVAAGPFHSQSNEAWFAHTPGLKVVYPSNAYDAKGLLISAFEDPNPVMYFEHKALYRQNATEVPKGYYNVPIGKAVLTQEGNDVSIITYGLGVHWALELAEKAEHNIEILDLRTLLPLDYEAIVKTVRKTGKVLVLHEDTLTGGLGGEIAAYISEHCFEYLDAPVFRVGGLDSPIPFTKSLEDHIFMPKKRLSDSFDKLMNY